MAELDLKYLWYAKDIYGFYRREGTLTALQNPDYKRLLKGDFGELEAYERIHASFVSEKNAPPRDLVIPGSLRHAIVEYRKSTEWQQLAPASHRSYNKPFNWLLEPPGIPKNADPKKPETMRHKGHGHRPLASMDQEVILVLRDLRYNPPEDMRYEKKRPDEKEGHDEEEEPPRVFPGAANDLLGALGALFAYVRLRRRQFRLPRGWTSPTDGVPGLPKGDGHRPWEEDEIDRFSNRCSLQTLQRAIRDAFLDTGQRGSDVWKMRREHFRQVKRPRDDLIGLLVSDREISVVQQKTKARVWIPASNELIPSVNWLLSSHDGEWFFMTEAGNSYVATSDDADFD